MRSNADYVQLLKKDELTEKDNLIKHLEREIYNRIVSDLEGIPNNRESADIINTWLHRWIQQNIATPIGTHIRTTLNEDGTVDVNIEYQPPVRRIHTNLWLGEE